MLRLLVVNLLATAAAFLFCAWVFPGWDINGGPFAVLWIAVLFGLVNIVIGPILRIVTLPVNVATLGLFGLVINGFLIAIVAGISDDLQIGKFLWTIVAAVVIAIVSSVVSHLLKPAIAPQAH